MVIEHQTEEQRTTEQPVPQQRAPTEVPIKTPEMKVGDPGQADENNDAISMQEEQDEFDE